MTDTNPLLIADQTFGGDMSKSLYYTRQFVTLHQKNPGFNPGNDLGNPYLQINGIDTVQRKYSLEVGRGDPGENPLYDTFDYSEFSLGFSTFVKPADYNSATFSYTTESSTYNKKLWGVVQVPDTFLLPADSISLSVGEFPAAALNDLRSFLMIYAQAKGVPGVELASQLNSPFELYGVLSSHMTKQFTLIQQVTSGAIDLATFDAQSTQASQTLVIDLANQAGVHSVVAEAAKQLISQRINAIDPSHVDVSTGIGSLGGAGFLISDRTSTYLIGSPSNDELIEAATNGDVIAAGAGDDVVYAGRGNGMLSGGAGTDTIAYGSVGASMYVDLDSGFARDANGTFQDRIAGFESVRGTSFADTFVGNSASNWLEGYGGNDSLYGGQGNDVLDGGAGQDVLNGGDGVDVARYSNEIIIPADIAIFRGLYISLENSSLNTGEAEGDIWTSIEGLSATNSADTLIGNEFDNVLYGNGGADQIFGRLGSDRIEGGAGGDLLAGEGGNDTIIGGADADLINGGDGSDTISGDDGNDFIYGDDPGTADYGDNIDGGAGADTIFGFGGNDTIYGGSDGDSISGGAGADSISGNDGNDFIQGGTEGDLINGGAGGDTLSGNEGNDFIYGDDPGTANFGDNIDGGDGADSIFGFGGNDTLWGGAGGDSLRGGEGGDTLRGQGGNDYLYGEGGADAFLYTERGFNVDQIFDFQDGVDKIQMSTGIFANYAAVRAAAMQVNTDVLINAGNGDQIAIKGFDMAHFTADDFMFF